MIINHNIASINTHRQMSAANVAQGKSMEKLSSGLRINRAGDDAAGLAISEKMRAQVRGLDQASRNAQDGISLIQTAEGALNETHAILQRMRELAVQSSNDTNVEADRKALDAEYQELAKEVDRIAQDTEFNTQKLWKHDGTDADGNAITSTVVDFQIGANASQKISFEFGNMAFENLSEERDSNEIDADGNPIKIAAGAGGITSKDASQTAIDTLDIAIAKVSETRSNLGAIQNRLEYTINNLNTSSENLTAAESRIRDVDMAKEISEQTKQSILAQASQAMLAQANQQPQNVLSLLR